MKCVTRLEKLARPCVAWFSHSSKIEGKNACFTASLALARYGQSMGLRGAWSSMLNRRFGSALSLGVMLSGCASVPPPDVQSPAPSVSLVYRFRTVSEVELLEMVEGLRQGTLTMDSTDDGDLNDCDAVSSTAMHLDLSYDDFDRIDHARLSSGGLLVKQHYAIPANIACAIPDSPAVLSIQTGRGLAQSGVDTLGNANLRIDGVDYAGDSRLYYRFRVLTRDGNSGLTTGSFEFIGRNASDPNDLRVVVVRNGMFVVIEP